MVLQRFLCVLCLFWTGIAHALPSDPYELFQTMMGQTGEWDWKGLSQEQIWDNPHVQNCAGQPFNHYMEAIQYLKQEPINTIPKIIHFIWIGPNPFPQQSISNLISWKNHHPNWKFFFWTDDPNRPPPIEGMQQRLITDFDFGPLQRCIEGSQNWGERADIMRYMIIYKEGGIYTDHDVECIRPLDPLTSRYDFVAGYAALHNYHFSLNRPFSPNNGIIISRQHHPIMKETIDRLVARWDEMTELFHDRFGRVMSRSFDPFTYCSTHFIDIPGYRNMLLPASYLHSAWSFDEQIRQELIEQGHVYAIHRYAGLW